LVDHHKMVVWAPRLSFRPRYVSFNLPDCDADAYISFMLLGAAADLAQAWKAVSGRKLNSKFSGTMSFCSEGVAEAMNSGMPTVALGCEKAIKTAGLQGQVCVCLFEKSVRKLAAVWAHSHMSVAVGA